MIQHGPPIAQSTARSASAQGNPLSFVPPPPLPPPYNEPKQTQENLKGKFEDKDNRKEKLENQTEKKENYDTSWVNPFILDASRKIALEEKPIKLEIPEGKNSAYDNLSPRNHVELGMEFPKTWISNKSPESLWKVESIVERSRLFSVVQKPIDHYSIKDHNNAYYYGGKEPSGTSIKDPNGRSDNGSHFTGGSRHSSQGYHPAYNYHGEHSQRRHYHRDSIYEKHTKRENYSRNARYPDSRGQPHFHDKISCDDSHKSDHYESVTQSNHGKPSPSRRSSLSSREQIPSKDPA